MKRPSLRLNLIKSLLPPLASSFILIGVFAVLSIYHEVDEVYDATLVQFARTLSHTTPQSPEKTEDSRLAHKYERNISYRIFHEGKAVIQSADAIALDGLEPEPGFSDQNIKGKSWRFFTLIDEGSGYTIEVAEKYSIRHELTLQLLSSLVLPGVVFIIFAFAVIWWGVTRGLQRLVKLSTEMDRREAGDLTPISDPSVPIEIQPLLDALNRLFSRIGQSFIREREFTDNAAHELRTPLAAMKTQAQVIVKTELLTAEGRKGFDNLLSSIDRAIDMMESLLSFARLQSDTSDKKSVDLCDLTEKECANLEKQAAIKHITLEIKCDKNAIVTGIAHALALMIRNVVQNAIKFTPERGRINVTIKKLGNEVTITVADTGPGIPDEYKPRVFERFFRINKSAKTGSGLGLAMTKWVADMHQAQIELLDNSPSGLIVNITFPSFISAH